MQCRACYEEEKMEKAKAKEKGEGWERERKEKRRMERENDEQLPAEMTFFIMFQLYPVLLNKYVLDLVKCYGKNSDVTRHAKTRFAERLIEYRQINTASGLPSEYVFLEKSEEQKDCLVREVKKLLEWAGIPALTKGQLFSI
jgi:hypothetical protein